MTNFAEIVSHLSADDPAQNISKIKAAVVGELKNADSQVHVEVTDHFNHSFVPDLVLSWPGVSESRHVFLRTSFDVPDLLRDVDVLSQQQPILMPLARVTDTSDSIQGPLRMATRARRILVTDPYGLEALQSEIELQPVVSLFSHAVLQGGRGLVSSERARQASNQVGAGFAGAQTADLETTIVAVETADELLDSHRASQVNRLLHAIWVGSGAPGTTFPGAAGVTAILDAQSLRFILELPEVNDSGFWARLGRGLTTERLCELGDFPAAENLQRLLDGNAHRLYAKACRVFQVSSSTEMPLWSIMRGNLTLHTLDSRVHFAPRAVAELPENNEEVVGLSVAGLRDRAAKANVKVGEIKLSNGESVLSYGSETRPDISQDKVLASLQAVIADGSVTSVVARITENKHVRCTFSTGTGAGNSSSRFYVAELATVAVPLLIDLTPSEIASIREKVSSPEPIEDAADDPQHDVKTGTQVQSGHEVTKDI